jgi:hypothetical protein
MTKDDGHASLVVPYSVVDVTDSKRNPWKLQVAEIPEGYKVEGPVCQPFKLLATLHNDGKTLVMTKYHPPRLKDKLNPKYRKVFWGIKKWNSIPRQLNDIYVRGAIGTENDFKELEEINVEYEKMKDTLSRMDYQEQLKHEKERTELFLKEMRKSEECYDSGAARLKPGKMSEKSVRAIKENENLKALLANWDWRRDNGSEHRLRPNFVSLEGLFS